MFSRSDELLEIFNSLDMSRVVRGQNVVLADMATEVKADLAKPNRMYYLLDLLGVNPILQGDHHFMMVGIDGIVNILRDRDTRRDTLINTRTSMHPSLIKTSIEDVSVLSFPADNRIFVGFKALDKPASQKERLAQAIDNLTDANAYVLGAGDGFWPLKGNSPSGRKYTNRKDKSRYRNSLGVVSHDCPCLVNPTSQPTQVLMRIVYEDETPPVEYGWTMAPESSLHARLDLITHKDRKPLVTKDKTYSVVIYTDNPALNGVMSRAWAGERGTVDAFMSASLARINLPKQDRMLASELKSRIKDAQAQCRYK